MPTLPLPPCGYPRCSRKKANAKERYCNEHKKVVRAEHDAQRGSSSERGYDTDWKRLRDSFLSRNPLCDECMQQEHHITSATVVDHIKPIADYPELRLVWSNLRALCKSHHDMHTAKTKGWGRGHKIAMT